MRNKSKSISLESKGVLYSSKEQNAFLKYDTTMGENQILLQLTRDVQQGLREFKETHMLKVSHHLDHLKTPIITSYKIGETGTSTLSYHSAVQPDSQASAAKMSF